LVYQEHVLGCKIEEKGQGGYGYGVSWRVTNQMWGRRGGVKKVAPNSGKLAGSNRDLGRGVWKGRGKMSSSYVQ